MITSECILKRQSFSESIFDQSVEHSPSVIALCASSHPGIRRVRCYVKRGIARLEGRLGTYYQKQLAQEIVRRVEGVETIDNRIVVEVNL